MPGRRPKGNLPQPQPPQWRKRRPSSAARLFREDPEWRPFESFSKGTPPPGWRWTRRRSTRAAVGAVAPPPTDGGRVRGRTPRGHGGQRTDTPTTATPTSPPATGMNEAVDIAEEWLAEEAETSPWSRRVRVRISLLPTGARSLPRAGPRPPGGATWMRMMTWTSTTQRSPHLWTHRGDPAETHRDPLAEDHQDPMEDAPQVDPLEADHRAGEDRLDRADPAEALLEDPPGDPDDPPGSGDPDATWRWIFHLRRRVQSLEREVDTGKGEMTRIARVTAGAQRELDIAKMEMVKSAKVATATQTELDIARGEIRSLNRVINGLQQRLDALEGRGSVGSDHPPLESGSSDDGWGPGPGLGRPHAPGGAPRSCPSASAPSLSAPSHHSAGRRNERVPPGSGSKDWRDEWLSAEYHNRRAPPRTPVRPRRPAPALEPIPMAGGRYGGLRDEVPRGDVEWNIGGGEQDLEEFGISPPRGVRREAAERSCRRRDEEAYMEGVRREHLGSAYMEEPRRGHTDTGEEMEVAAVGVRGRGRWEPRSTSQPAFMVSKAADAAVWEDLKDIKPPMYDGNPLNLNRFLEKLDDWGVTVTEDMDPADAEKYVFRRFRYSLPEVLQELYFVATKEGKIKTLKEAKKWLNEHERVDAPQVAAKRWKSIKLQHDGREIDLRDWRHFWGQYTLFRRNVEDWNEGDEQARLLSVLPEAWIKRVTKEEAKRAKSNHTLKMMLPKEYHTNVVAWTRKNLARDVKRHSLRNALLITVSDDREKTAMWRLDECDVRGQTIRLQAIPVRMSCDEILEWVGEKVLKEYRNLHHTCGLRPGDRDVNYVGEGPGGEAAMDAAGADGDETLVDDDDDDEPAEMAVCAFVANSLNAGSNRGSWKPLQQGGKKKEKRDPRRIGDAPLSFGEFIRAHPQGCFVCYGRKKGFNHDLRTCPIHQADTEAYKKAHGSKKRAPAGIREPKVEVDKDELSKLMSVGTELAKEIQEIKRNWVPRSENKNKEDNKNDRNKDKDKKTRNRGMKKGVNEVDAEENTPTSTSDAP